MMKNLKFKIGRWRCIGFVFIGITMMTGCQETDISDRELGCQVEAIPGQEDDVVGKWKMIWERPGFSLDTMYYSCNNIIYHFRPNGILEVASDIEEAGHSEGVYNYELIWDPYNSGAIEFRGIKIGDFQRWACLIKTTDMTLDLTPLDGPLRYFIRIE